MCQHKFEASQGFKKCDFFFDEEVSSLSLESLVLFLLNLDNHIARFNIRNFVSLAVDSVSLAIGCSFVNFNFQGFGLLFDFLPCTHFAHFRWVDTLALSAALVTRSCPLGVHARSELHHDGSHSLTFAPFAGNHCSSVSSTNAIALSADSMSLELDFELFAIVKVFKCHLNLLANRFHFLFLGLTTTSATHTKQVKDVSSLG